MRPIPVNTTASSTRDRQVEIHARWRLRAAHRQQRTHLRLLQNEFASAAQLRELRDRMLSALLIHCYDHVPYYQQCFARAGVERRHLGDTAILGSLPALTRQDVVDAGNTLHARQPMAGQHFASSTRTSGSTGEPVEVRHSNMSVGAFVWLKQREVRWFGWDPRSTLLSIRPPPELSPRDNGASVPRGTVQQLRYWPLLGEIFETGPAKGFSNINPVADQAEVLNIAKPAYLLMQSAGLEHLSMQAIRPEAKKSLRGALAISQTLTPAMREQVEQALSISVEQNYGLNEVGMVASRCPEGGRFHVHSEHCMVEIVDQDDRPCAPGETGRLLVTGLTNSIMPLLRYDADDLAEATDGPCPCGRTLPSFGRIVGRYRRTAFLPEGTFERWAAIQISLAGFGRANPGLIRQYQAIQDGSGDFLLRIDCSEETLRCLEADLRREFAAAAAPPCPELVIAASREFLGAEKRKFQNFISAFTPEDQQ